MLAYGRKQSIWGICGLYKTRLGLDIHSTNQGGTFIEMCWFYTSVVSLGHLCVVIQSRMPGLTKECVLRLSGRCGLNVEMILETRDRT